MSLSFMVVRSDFPVQVTTPDEGQLRIANQGPGTLLVTDGFDDTEGDTIAPGAGLDRASVSYLRCVERGQDAHVLLEILTPQITGGTPGAQGPPGPAGPAGPSGQDAVESSDAVRGQLDRFYRVVGGVLTYNGTEFTLNNDAFSRGQNIDGVTSDGHRITVNHEDISATHVVNTSATVGENLQSVGISALT